jgi:uncharacterized protein
VASALLDTGPLVALFRRNDAFHQRAVAWFKSHRSPLLTTHAVATESWHLVSPGVRLALVKFISVACEVCDLGADGASRIATTVERFADVPMDYADASLVVLAEIRKIYRVATIDFNDFTTYRTADGKVIKNVF